MTRCPRAIGRESTVSLFAVALVSSSPVAFPQQTLPAKAQADILRGQIERAYAAEDYPKLLSLISAYKKLNAVALPTPLLYVEAIAAQHSGRHEQAFRAMHQYLRRANDNDPQYASAVAVYPELREAADKETRGFSEILLRVAGTWKGAAECHREGRIYTFAFELIAPDPLDFSDQTRLSVTGFGRAGAGASDLTFVLPGSDAWQDRPVTLARGEFTQGVDVRDNVGVAMTLWNIREDNLMLENLRRDIGGAMVCGPGGARDFSGGYVTLMRIGR